MSIALRAVRSPLFLLPLFLIPTFLFLLTLALLFLLHGGHNNAHLSHNPHCRTLPQSPQSLLLPTTILLHISDLHISNFNPSSKSTLHYFETRTLPPYLPQASALLISGDFVDALTPNPYPFAPFSQQHTAEWAFIHHTLARINTSIPLLSAPGNHDSFGAPASLSPTPQHANLSCRLRPPRLATVLQLSSVSIIALDCTLAHPLHRPFNFFGDATGIVAELPDVLRDLEDWKPVVAFGHYPTSVMKHGSLIHASSGGKIVAYLSGHLHTLKGLAPRGLQAVVKNGAFELELPDMLDARVYRVLVFDRGILSFRDFNIEQRRPVVITNPPRAGFCAKGAGQVAVKSQYVRMVAGGAFLEGGNVIVDGFDIGSVELLEDCEQGEAKCVLVYGAKWNATEYDDGRVHELWVRFKDGEESDKHTFSFDGLSEGGLWSRWGTIVSALFALSEFDVMAPWLCHVGFLWCFLFCLPGLSRLAGTSMALFMAAALLMYGPAVIVAMGLSEVDKGIGLVGLRYIRLPSGVYASGVDVPYIMSVTVLYGSLLPVCFLDALSSTKILSSRVASIIANFFGLLYLHKSVSWCFEIFGAYGLLAGLISPSCVPLFAVLLYSTFNSLKRISKRRRLSC